MSLAFWTCTIVTGISAYTSLGFSLAALRSTAGDAYTNAQYAFVRSAGLAVLSTVPLFYQASVWAVAAAITMIFVQFGDGLIGVKIRQPVKTYGPFFTALLNLAAVIWLLVSG